MIRALVLLSILAFFGGCAPGLSSSLRVKPEGIELHDETSRVGSRAAGCIRIEQFLDQRKNAEIGLIDGRALVADGSVIASVERSVAKAFFAKSTGTDLCIPIQGELRDWIVVVTPEFPQSKIEGKCTLLLSVQPSEQSQGYRAIYTGNSTRSHPFADRDLVERTLDEALEECLKSAVNDDSMRRAVGW